MKKTEGFDQRHIVFLALAGNTAYTNKKIKYFVSCTSISQLTIKITLQVYSFGI